jgi:hypothetical protein
MPVEPVDPNCFNLSRSAVRGFVLVLVLVLDSGCRAWLVISRFRVHGSPQRVEWLDAWRGAAL